MDCFRIWVSIGSSSQDLGAECMINLRTSVPVVNAKQSNGCPQNIMSALNSPSPRFLLEYSKLVTDGGYFPGEKSSIFVCHFLLVVTCGENWTTVFA